MSVDLSWMRHGSCVGLDPDHQFPTDWDVAGIARARALCAGCAVRFECLGEVARISAVAGRGQRVVGVWGAMHLPEHGRSPRKAILAMVDTAIAAMEADMSTVTTVDVEADTDMAVT